ncbi:MAG: hypothetical protein OXR68_08485 [Alphaproteobacteria bacterium]|nr:hypothetical protein [Alphaproteobacteria bacterium]MDD9920643.1 hypothetical protein [Alphaproteobacteria bacterium]
MANGEKLNLNAEDSAIELLEKVLQALFEKPLRLLSVKRQSGHSEPGALRQVLLFNDVELIKFISLCEKDATVLISESAQVNIEGIGPFESMPPFLLEFIVNMYGQQWTRQYLEKKHKAKIKELEEKLNESESCKGKVSSELAQRKKELAALQKQMKNSIVSVGSRIMGVNATEFF